MAKIRGKITLYNRAGLRDNIPCQYIFDETPFYETQKISDKSQSEAISEINKNLSNAITQLQNQIETITGTKPDNIYRVVYDVDWSRIKADHNDYTNGVNHFEIIDKQDDEVLWAEVYCNNINGGNYPCNDCYSYQIDNGIVNEHKFWEDGNLNVPLGYNWRGGGTGGSISNTYIFTVKVRAAKILKFIDPVMEKALSAYYANTVTNVTAYGLVHIDNKLLDVEAEKITALDSNLHTRTGISDIWHDLKTTEDFRLLPNLTAFNDHVIAASANYITDLDTLYIPKSVKEINGFLTTNITDFTLKHIVVEEGNPVYDSRDNCDCLIRTADNTMIGGCMNSKIPASVTTVDGWWYGKGIKRLSLPDTLTSWPSSNTDSSPAHYKTFPDLEYLRLSAGIKDYEGIIISSCPNLKELVIPEGIETIAGTISFPIFNSNTLLTTLELPSTFVKCNPPAFYQSGGVKKLILHCDYTRDVMGGIGGPMNIEEFVFDCENVVLNSNNNGDIRVAKKITFTDKVKSIPEYFCINSIALEELNFGKGITEIPNNAFASSINKLTKLYLPKNIKTVGNYAFPSNSNLDSQLKTIDAPGVESIGEFAFWSHNLEKLNIPNVVNIKTKAFYECCMSNNIKIDCSKLETIGEQAFYDFYGKINAPNVLNIANQAFSGGNTSGTGAEITIGGRAELATNAFQECYGTVIIKDENCDYSSYSFANGPKNLRIQCSGEANMGAMKFINIIGFESGSVICTENDRNIYNNYVYVPDVSHYALTTAYATYSQVPLNGGPSLQLISQFDDALNSYYKEITIKPEGNLTIIKPYVFWYLSFNGIISIKEGITEIGKGAFSSSWANATIKIPASVTIVGEDSLSFKGVKYFYGLPPTGIETAFYTGTIYVKPEYLEQWQAVEWQGDVTIEVMDE